MGGILSDSQMLDIINMAGLNHNSAPAGRRLLDLAVPGDARCKMEADRFHTLSLDPSTVRADAMVELSALETSGTTSRLELESAS